MTPRLSRSSRRPLRRLVADLVAVAIAVHAGEQAGPPAVASEVPRLVTLAVIQSAREDHLRREARHLHVTTPAHVRLDLARLARLVQRNDLLLHGASCSSRRRRVASDCGPGS